jgi:hypothetical protein
MPGLVHFLRCVGRAALKNGGKALCSLVPGGEAAFDIARDACEEYRKLHGADRLRDELQLLAQAPPARVRLLTREVVAGEAPAQPPEVRLALASYLDGLPDLELLPVLVPGQERTYTLRKLLAVGDAADIHLAEADGVDYALKVSRVPGGDALLDNERVVLDDLLRAAEGTTYRAYLPALVESFPLKDEFPKRVNCFLHEPGFFTLEQVHERHPGLDGRHLGWIFNRLLTVLGFCGRRGVVHAAVLPCHVLIHPAGHGLRLVGWGESARVGQRIRHVPTRYRDWYPPEVPNRAPASPATDIFLAARCVTWLAGAGGPPESMRRFLAACLMPGARMRQGDAWKLMDEFGDLLRQLYGPPAFHDLEMGGEHG